MDYFFKSLEIHSIQKQKNTEEQMKCSFLSKQQDNYSILKMAKINLKRQEKRLSEQTDMKHGKKGVDE